MGPHSRYILASLEREPYEEYCDRNIIRQKMTYTHHHKALLKNAILQANSHPSYADQDESKVSLDSNARVSLDNESHLIPFIAGNTNTNNSTLAPPPPTPPSPQKYQSRLPTAPGTPPFPPPTCVATESIKAAQNLTVQNLLINSVPAPNGNHSMTGGVDVEEVATIPTPNDVNFSHRDGSVVDWCRASISGVGAS